MGRGSSKMGGGSGASGGKAMAPAQNLKNLIKSGDVDALATELQNVPKGTRIIQTNSNDGDVYLWEKYGDKAWGYARYNYGSLTYSVGNQRAKKVARDMIIGKNLPIQITTI